MMTSIEETLAGTGVRGYQENKYPLQFALAVPENKRRVIVVRHDADRPQGRSLADGLGEGQRDGREQQVWPWASI
jgi:hypothetical protein